MFTIEHLDGSMLKADEQGWKVLDMSKDSIEADVVSESPTMRPGRLAYGISYGVRTHTLSFTALYSDNVAYEKLVDLVNYHFLRDEPFYLYRDFRKPKERTSLPVKRDYVAGLSVKPKRIGDHKVQFDVSCESYELPFSEDSQIQTRTWTGTHQFTNGGGYKIDPRFCFAKMTITAKGAGNDLKITVNGQPYFWYKRAVSAGDKFIIDGTDVTKNSYNCFEDCHKQTTFFKVGTNQIKITGAPCEVIFEYRQLYL